MANGYPLAALVGKINAKTGDVVSGTFAGELLSIEHV